QGVKPPLAVAPHTAAATFSPRGEKDNVAAILPSPQRLRGHAPSPFAGTRRTGRSTWLGPGGRA
ncbi:MAG TPA: hypothetical protein VFY63_06160, partial [Pseudorhizobium sp.]|nr:hypothetical protein [Pseudorhizobium sp.]